jgi:hypothetical protein
MKLQPGDILLFQVNKHSPIHDKIIAFGEWLLHKQFAKHKYCHAAMVDEDTTLMLEAVWPKTHVYTITGRGNTVDVYRVKRASKKQIKVALDWAHANLNVWYNVGKLFFGLFPRKHEVICSTYVAGAWKAAGVVLGDLDEKVFSPDEIATSPLIKKVR